MLAYLALAYAIRKAKTGRFSDSSNRFLLTRIFDGATFAGSSILLVGIFKPRVLELIGDTKPFLIVAGIAGIVYALHALDPDD